MFVLPPPTPRSPFIDKAIPAFSQIKNFQELLSIYKTDFVPFCLESKANLSPSIEFTRIQKALPEIDDGDFIRSLVREYDQLILERLFQTFKEFQPELLGNKTQKFEVMEVGAGYSYSFNPEHISAPWLSRWLASRFSELEIIVSDIAEYWIQSLEIKNFHLKGAISLDYCHLDLQTPASKHFIFGRHLNEISTERLLVHSADSPSSNDFGYADQVSCEVDELLNGLNRILRFGGQALIDFDRGPLLDLKLRRMLSIDWIHYNYLEDRVSGSRVFPEATQLGPQLASVNFS